MAFVIPDTGELAFISQRTSRHAAAVARSGAVAGVVYNSTVTPEDAESVQFLGTCADVGEDVSWVRRVLRGFLRVSGGPEDGEPSEELVQRIFTDPDKGVFVISVGEMFVLDQAAWFERQIDAREAVNVPSVFSLLLDKDGILQGNSV